MATEPPLPNRYRIEVRHPDQDGTDVEVIAADEADALAQAAAAAPEGSTLHRVVPMEIGYVAPDAVPPPEPTSTTASSMSAGMSSGRATGVGSEPRLESDDDEDHGRKGRRK